MSQHASAVFNNSCLKVPRNPHNKKPNPIYDQKLINQLENQARKLSLSSNDSKNSETHPMKSFLEFFDSIPEYDEINHLSNKEFYKRLEQLKQQKRLYLDYLQNEIKYSYKDAWIDDYKPKSAQKSFCSTPNLNKPSDNVNEDAESIFSADKERINNVKPSSRRSVRIESPPEKCSYDLDYYRPKSRANLSSANSKDNKTSSAYNESVFGDVSDLDTLATKSAPSSPRKPSVAWKDCEVAAKQFQMTVTDEDDKIVEEFGVDTKKAINKDMFRANPVPIESQIPLFDKIMLDQKIRSEKVKIKRKAALQSQMRPFSFTQREEEWQALTNRLSRSTPTLFLPEKPKKAKQFKAKPIPKNLFSNYVYKKMHEDEYYRALQKKIRSEEMLKASSLPPSMAKREKTKPAHYICPRTFKDINLNVREEDKDNFDKTLAELELDFILATPSPKPTKIKTKKKTKKSQRKSSSSSRESVRSLSALGSVNRSNLAAVLRIETARKKLENEMAQRLEEQRCREEARWREKVLRRRPVWQTLAYSHEEDLKMRLQLRRDEENLRKEEHKMQMQTILGRVHQQPTLYERQAQVGSSKSKDDFITKLYKNISSHSNSSSSKVSSTNGSEDRRVVEMKDESIQANFGQMENTDQ